MNELSEQVQKLEKDNKVMKEMLGLTCHDPLAQIYTLRDLEARVTSLREELCQERNKNKNQCGSIEHLSARCGDLEQENQTLKEEMGKVPCSLGRIDWREACRKEAEMSQARLNIIRDLEGQVSCLKTQNRQLERDLDLSKDTNRALRKSLEEQEQKVKDEAARREYWVARSRDHYDAYCALRDKIKGVL